MVVFNSFFSLNKYCVLICVYAEPPQHTHTCVVQEEVKKDIGNRRGGYELPDMSVGNQTRVVFESSTCS